MKDIAEQIAWLRDQAAFASVIATEIHDLGDEQLAVNWDDTAARLTRAADALDVPEAVTTLLAQNLRQDGVRGRIDPAGVLRRPAPMFGGKSATQYIADGDGTWDDVLAKYQDTFAAEFRG